MNCGVRRSEQQDEEERTFEIGDNLHTALAAVIQQTMNIEGIASTEMEVVKRKERQWRDGTSAVATVSRSRRPLARSKRWLADRRD